MGTEEDGSAEAFHDRLRDAVREAHAKGVDVEGSWPVKNDESSVPDWDVEIVLLEKPDE
jgi:hypothetical protein